MFWTRRLRGDGEPASWAVPYGDLMSLLLAVFVMIAAMSELRGGRRFERVESAVRSAFGFVPSEPRLALQHQSNPAPTLLERLEDVGLSGESTVRLAGPRGDVLPACQVRSEREHLIIHFPEAELFEDRTAALGSRGQRLISRLGEVLRDGKLPLQIQAFSAAADNRPGVPFEDGLDLAYERTRAMAHGLLQAGVARDRLLLTVRADAAPDLKRDPGTTRSGISIVVHAGVPGVLPADGRESAGF
ncbi:MAG: hypothetical protein AMXMBFR13_51210 [Phycisphaerae bacterium]